MSDREMKTQVERVAEWIVDLRFSDIPENAISLAKLQILDLIAAICAGSTSLGGKRVRQCVERTCAHGPCTVIPDGDALSIFDAVYLHAALANALELDNLVFMGHVSQSAVSVPLALGQDLDADGKDLLTAQIAAVEVAGRMGAHLASGPQQGHMRTYLHLVAAATAASRLLRLSVQETATALAIALSMPEFPLYPAVFSPDTKIVCTSAPAVAGIRAAFLAAAGLDAARDIVEHAAGFIRHFSYATTVPDLWARIGRTWSIFALSSKNSAACAYAQGPVAAALDLASSGDISIDLITEVEIHAPLTTVVMESFSASHLGADITPVNTNFSTRRSVSAALHSGNLDGSFFDADSFSTNASHIKSIYGKTRLIHDWGMTVDLIRGMDDAIEGAGRPGVFGMNQTHKTLKNFHREFGSERPPGWRSLPGLTGLTAEDRNYLFTRYWRGLRAYLPFTGGKAERDGYVAFEKDLSRLSFRQAGRVVVKHRDGTTHSAQCRVPPGFAGDPSRESTIRTKYDRETSRIVGKARTQTIRDAVDSLPDVTARQLLSCLANGDRTTKVG